MRELQEQVRDLMFYLETQKKIAQSPEGARQVSWRATPVCTARVCVRETVSCEHHYSCAVQELREGQVVVTQGASGASSSSSSSSSTPARKGRKKR